MEQWSEEDFKIKIVLPFFRKRDFNLKDMEFEKPYKLTVGSKRINVYSDILVKIKGQPIFLVETKRPRHKIIVDDIDQAISYARLNSTIAPYTIVTNFQETRLFNTFTREEITHLESFKVSQNISKKHTLSNEFKLDALRQLFNLNYDFLIEFCRSQRAIQMAHLLNPRMEIGKFAHELYLPRKKVIRQFNAFMKSTKPCFALIGNQGTGKTFNMIALAENYGKRNPALFYDSGYVSGKIHRAIEEDFGWQKDRKPWIGEILSNLEEILKKNSSQAVIFIDAINEPVPKYFRKTDIINLIRRLENSPIKLCIACRSQDWEFFSMDKGDIGAISWWIHLPVGTQLRNYTATEIENITTAGSCEVDNFTDSELRQVFLKYKEVYNLRGGLTSETGELCKHPEFLRVVSRIYQGQVLPQSLRRRRVLSEFWTKKLSSISFGETTEQFLISIGELILKNKNPEVKVTDMIKSDWNDVYQKIYERALSENLFQIRKSNDGSYLRIIPDIMMEYVVAKCFFQKYSKIIKACNSDIDSVFLKLEHIPGQEGIMLLVSSLSGNPLHLISYLLLKINAQTIIDHIFDEKPELIDSLLLDQKNFSEVLKDLSKEIDIYRIISTIKKLVSRKQKHTDELVIKLILSERLQFDGVRVTKVIKHIVDNAKTSEHYSTLFHMLLTELEKAGQRRLVNLLYLINRANPQLANKILSKFKIGKLRSFIITQSEEKYESGRSLYLLTKVNKNIAARIEPSGKILESYKKALKSGKVKRPKPFLSLSNKRHRYIHNHILEMLYDNPQGLTWKQICGKCRSNPYKILVRLQRLLMEGIIHRELVDQEQIIFRYFVPQKLDSKQPVLTETYESLVRRFTEEIIDSNFSLTQEGIDRNIEKLMLGWTLERWEIRRDFVYDVYGYSINITLERGNKTLEIPGKTFVFINEWLKRQKGFGKHLSVNIIDNFSKSAPNMFKNMIFGVRKSNKFRNNKSIEITTAKELKQRLKEFKRYYGKIGVVVPSEESIFKKCIDELEKMYPRPVDSSIITRRLKNVFKKKAQLSLIEKITIDR